MGCSLGTHGRRFHLFWTMEHRGWAKLVSPKSDEFKAWSRSVGLDINSYWFPYRLHRLSTHIRIRFSENRISMHWCHVPLNKRLNHHVPSNIAIFGAFFQIFRHIYSQIGTGRGWKKTCRSFLTTRSKSSLQPQPSSAGSPCTFAFLFRGKAQGKFGGCDWGSRFDMV